MRVRWTRKGVLLLFAGALLALLGAATASPLPVLMGAGVGGVLLASTAQRLGVPVEVRHAAGRDRVLEGDPVRVEVEAHTPSALGCILEVQDRLHPALRVGEGSSRGVVWLTRRRPLRLNFTLECPIPGAYDVGRLDVRASDLLGLRDGRAQAGEGASLLVLPRGEELGAPAMRSLYPRASLGMHPVRRAGVGMSFHALRDYAPSDEMRMVDWKASARRSSLVVREHEQESSAEATVFVDTRAAAALGTVAGNGLVRGMRAAAALVEALLDTRSAVRLVTYGAITHQVQPGAGERHHHQCLTRLASLRPGGSAGFAEALDHVLPHLKPRSPAFVVSPLVADPSVAEGVGRLLAQHSSVTVVSPSAVDALADLAASGLPDGEALRARLAAERTRDLDRLRGLGARVVDWRGAERLAAAMEREGAA